MDRGDEPDSEADRGEGRGEGDDEDDRGGETSVLLWGMVRSAMDAMAGDPGSAKAIVVAKGPERLVAHS